MHINKMMITEIRIHCSAKGNLCVIYAIFLALAP